MKIFINFDKEKINADCLVTKSAALLPGTVQEGQNAGGNCIMVGAVDPMEETFEECLREGLEGALVLAEKRGYGSLAIDGETFASERSLAPYVWNTLLDVLTECGAASPNRTLEINVYLPAEGNDAILQTVEHAITAPVTETEQQSYTDWSEVEEKLERHLKKGPQKVSGEKCFRDLLNDLIEARSFRKFSEVYRACGISKSTFSKCLNYTIEYRPSKSTVAALVIGLKLDEEGAQKLYHSAGYHLGNIDLTDRIVRFFLKEKIYDVYEVNCCLTYYGLPLLGEHSREEKST